MTPAPPNEECTYNCGPCYYVTITNNSGDSSCFVSKIDIRSDHPWTICEAKIITLVSPAGDWGKVTGHPKPWDVECPNSQMITIGPQSGASFLQAGHTLRLLICINGHDGKLDLSPEYNCSNFPSSTPCLKRFHYQ